MKTSIFLIWIISSCITGGHSISESTIEDIVGVLADGTADILGNCSTIPNNTVEFFLFSKQANQTALNLDNPSQINVTRPIVILIHGWRSSINTSYIQEIKNAYVKNINESQVIMVDWSALAAQDYFTVFCNLQQVSAVLEQFVCNLHDKLNLDLSQLHIVGHSLGAQLTGIAGPFIREQCGAVGRMTGLDPAGPLFQGLPDGQRLTKDDANFVDVIHTDAGVFGYTGDCGSVDFYVNSGSLQPGCLNQSLSEATNITGVIDVPQNDAFCNHIRSCMYFAESIGNGVFEGTSCSLCPVVIEKDPILPETLVMGEFTPTTFVKNMYVVTTNAESPFAQQTKSGLQK